jgi:hypothetical protein
MWVVWSEFEHELNFIFSLFAGIGLALDVEFLRVGLFDRMELL